MFDNNEYDRDVNTFSSQGRLFQVEYAMKAVNDGWTSIGIQCKEGVVLAAEKKILSKLQIPSSIEKVYKVEDNVICTYSGLLSDARALMETARVEAANHWFTFNEKMPVESIALSVCDLALSFAEKDSKKGEKEKKRVSRPYGCALLIAGIDHDNTPLLFKTDPSGNYTRFKACAIGSGGDNGMLTLQEQYNENMTLREAYILAARIIKDNMEQRINKDNIELSYVSTQDKRIKKFSTEEIEDLIKIL